MNKLQKILDHCKCGVYLTVNEHRDIYITAAERLEDLECLECPPIISQEVRQKMIDLNAIIDLQFYPDTPIGFYSIYHYDLDKALDEALQIIKGKNNGQSRNIST